MLVSGIRQEQACPAYAPPVVPSCSPGHHSCCPLCLLLLLPCCCTACATNDVHRLFSSIMARWRGMFGATQRCVQVCKMLEKRLWDTQHPLWQFPSLLESHYISKLETFGLWPEQLHEMEPAVRARDQLTCVSLEYTGTYRYCTGILWKSICTPYNLQVYGCTGIQSAALPLCSSLTHVHLSAPSKLAHSCCLLYSL